MSGFFQVDLDVLQRFVTSLRESGEHMENALDAMKSVQGGQIGTPDLDDAANDFQHTWRYGLGQLKDKIKETGDGVTKAHGSYQDLEQELTQSLGQLGTAIEGSI